MYDSSFMNSLCCYFRLSLTSDHKNSVVIDVVVDQAWAESQVLQENLINLPFEALAEYIVDQWIVHSGALRKHAWQETYFRWDGAAVFEDRPQTHHAVWRPAA